MIPSTKPEVARRIPTGVIIAAVVLASIVEGGVAHAGCRRAVVPRWGRQGVVAPRGMVILRRPMLLQRPRYVRPQYVMPRYAPPVTTQRRGTIDDVQQG